MVDILQKPVISEKAAKFAEEGTYAFVVSSRANKITVARAVAGKFGVTVVSVRMVQVPGRKIRRGAHTGWKRGFKKALVTVQKGQKIELA